MYFHAIGVGQPFRAPNSEQAGATALDWRRLVIVEYCSPSTLDDWIPNLFVDIHDEFEHKLRRWVNSKSQIC